MSEEDTRALLLSLQTGDVLLYENIDLGSAFIRFALRSRVSHVGLVLRMPRERCGGFYAHNADYANDAPSSPECEDLHVLEAVPRRGVALFPLEARLARTVNVTQGLSVRRLRLRSGSRPPALEAAKLYQFLEENISRRLETAGRDCAPVAAYLHQLCCPTSSAPGALSRVLKEDHSAFFCTELVAEALMQLGVLRRDPTVLAADFLPNAFMSNSCSPWGSQLKLTLDSACNEAYAFGPEQVLLTGGTSPLRQFLKSRKDELRRHLKVRDNTPMAAAAGLKWHKKTHVHHEQQQ
ncbi:hypothetical protein AB1Y20_007455 [Prymnesium parvum]|uniref:Uncharacterized protein n=1 Tax=Prymnesium parvum TaxID=97485 RepID=A0AB34IV15_PRYPA